MGLEVRGSTLPLRGQVSHLQSPGLRLLDLEPLTLLSLRPHPPKPRGGAPVAEPRNQAGTTCVSRCLSISLASVLVAPKWSDAEAKGPGCVCPQVSGWTLRGEDPAPEHVPQPLGLWHFNCLQAGQA